jgi:energy-converting hydrogenase Eha subunit A
VRERPHLPEDDLKVSSSDQEPALTHDADQRRSWLHRATIPAPIFAVAAVANSNTLLTDMTDQYNYINRRYLCKG